LRDNIFKVVDDINDYIELKRVQDLGLTVHHSEFDYEKIMMFSWIKEALDGGKHRV
jgi:hypothetical protein